VFAQQKLYGFGQTTGITIEIALRLYHVRRLCCRNER